MRLMMPEVERSHAHRKLHSIDFIERRRMCEKVKREAAKKRNTDLITDCWPESLCSVSKNFLTIRCRACPHVSADLRGPCCFDCTGLHAAAAGWEKAASASALH